MGKPRESEELKKNLSIALGREAREKADMESEGNGVSRSRYIETLIIAGDHAAQYLDYESRIEYLSNQNATDEEETLEEISFLEHQIESKKKNLARRKEERDGQIEKLLALLDIIKTASDTQPATEGTPQRAASEEEERKKVLNQSEKKSYELYHGVGKVIGFYTQLCDLASKYNPRQNGGYVIEPEQLAGTWRTLSETANRIKWKNLSLGDIQSTRNILKREYIPTEKAASILETIEKWINPKDES